MTVTGDENYTTAYTYDANNRLLTEAKTENSATVTTTYTYDANGNNTRKETADSITANTYNNFNQLIQVGINGLVATYEYNAQGIRTTKTVGENQTNFLLDGGNVIAEIQGNTTINYLRGVNLINKTVNSATEYYSFNAHGDVVNLTNSTGTTIKTYDYDAFGNERNPDETDPNPFRYCGEYWDPETGTYYLRARYYDPAIGRFTQADSHWNTSNMIYGDSPQKINEREDRLGLEFCSCVPRIAAIMEIGNLYVYCLNNSVNYIDYSGYWTVSVSLSGNVILGIGLSGSIGISFDGHGNYEVQYSYSVPGVNNTATVGILSMAGGVAVQGTNADTVYQLRGPATYIGASFEMVGADLLSFNDASDLNSSVDGVQFFVGRGKGIDVHIMETYSGVIRLPSKTTENLSGVAAPNKSHGGSAQAVRFYNSLN